MSLGRALSLTIDNLIRNDSNGSVSKDLDCGEKAMQARTIRHCKSRFQHTLQNERHSRIERAWLMDHGVEIRRDAISHFLHDAISLVPLLPDNCRKSLVVYWPCYIRPIASVGTRACGA